MPKYDVVEAISAYVQEEPDERLRQEALALLHEFQSGNQTLRPLIEERFLGKLQFGTAGIRAQMESGFNRLNQVTVAKIAYAIGSFLGNRKEQENSKEKTVSIVVGHDARLKSELFAKEVASVLLGLGFEVFLFEESVATPICAFSVKELGSIGGIMVTASHNPPHDNGIKVYAETGAQIVSPDDQAIEAILQEAPGYQLLPRRKPEGDPKIHRVPDGVLKNYFERISTNRISPGATRKSLSIVYTPLHGVGFRFIEQALKACPFVSLHAVEEQKEPDGHFPTVEFPNPEEKGALDLAVAFAEAIKADLIIANDPDADRLAVAVPLNGKYTMISGNELGAILGCDVLENASCERTKLVVSTLVSSRLLSTMANTNRASYAESLTGFSKIAQIAFNREATYNEQFVFGFEEALGYCVGDFVRDKDGICAAIRLLERTALLKAAGRTLWDELERIALKYGLYRNLQWSFRFSGVKARSKMQSIMTELRKLSAGVTYFDGRHIESRHDLLTESFQDFPKANVLVFNLDGGLRVVVRPSGTEPKIKFYAETSAQVDSKQRLVQKQLQLDVELQEHRKKVETSLKEWLE